MGGNIQAPYGVSFSPMMVVESGQPFNIDIGQDLNGDNQFNDRPAFATSASTNVLADPLRSFRSQSGGRCRRAFPSTSARARRNSA